MTDRPAELFPVNADGECGIPASREALINRYVRDEMVEDERIAFIDHILFCSACNRELRLREGITETLQHELVSDEYLHRAQDILDRRAQGQAAIQDVGKFSGRYWLRVAAVFIGTLLLSLGAYYLSAPSPSPWQQVAALDPAGTAHQFLQDAGNDQWRSYNEGLTLLAQAGHKEWFRPGIQYDTAGVRSAIAKLAESYSTSLPEARRMDLVYYLFKANLMIEQPDEALGWLERSKSIGANKTKVERAINACRQFQSAVQNEQARTDRRLPPEQLEAWRVRATGIEQDLQMLISQ